MSRKSLLRMFARIGFAALTAGTIAGIGSCSDGGGGTSVSSVCHDNCKVNEECWDIDYSDEEMDDCVDSCKNDWEDDSDYECHSEELDAEACYLDELLDNGCDEGEAEDACDNEFEKLDDCDEGDFTEGSPDSDSDADV
jgi:hypothetical protein